MTAANITDTRGAAMFARYAYCPNRLGYCGPSDSSALLSGARDQIEQAARQFTGAWPYLEVLAKQVGIADPLDHRLVESYWLGGGIGAKLDPRVFIDELLSIIAPQAGHYWTHLTEDLAQEAMPNHSFHVFAVYPWSRLLGKGADDQPLSILDDCRISWGTVLSTDEVTAVVLSSRLRFKDSALSLASPETLRVEMPSRAGYDGAIEPGDIVAVHWRRICDRLTPEQVARLKDSTDRQLHATSHRLGTRSS
jgi:hypothetical protein